jgi:hypothetical protein
LTVRGNTTFIDQQTLAVGDPLIYLAANNYTSDIVDIGFIANYVNTGGSNVHTGLYRSSGSKEYYLFQGYDKEPINNYIDPAGNNFTAAILNSTVRTSNLILGGANAINWITSAYNKANAGGANVGQTTPTGAVSGSLWWNSDLGKMFIYYTDPANTSAWIETSPSASVIEGAIITGYINPISDTTNAAFGIANGAYSTGNNAYASVNSNWSVTNAIYGIANTALQNTTTTYSGSLTIFGNLSFTSANNNLTVPAGSTAGRPSLAANGMIRYNTTLNTFEGYKAGTWGAIGGGATGGGSDDAFYENTTTITSDYTITTNKNAMTAGPVTLNSGVTVTVPVGSTWTVV